MQISLMPRDEIVIRLEPDEWPKFRTAIERAGVIFTALSLASMESADRASFELKDYRDADELSDYFAQILGKIDYIPA
jgi:hypothetical protein